MYSLTAQCLLKNFYAKSRTSILIIASNLIFSPLLAHAEPGLALQEIQKIAGTDAMEIGTALANDHWTRVEFSKVYIDPVVVVEPFSGNGKDTYIAGIRNIDTMGFEINLRSCNNSTDVPHQETINFSVLDKGQLPTSNRANTELRQRFAWGDCPASS
jgi:hypothetical protein